MAKSETKCSEVLEGIVENAGRMWPYNLVPIEKIENDFEFKVTPEFLDHLRESSVRLDSGGSGSFVSKSLIVTNHHVARATLNDISSAENDYVKHGYYAATPDKEIKAKDLEINVLKLMIDVSDQVNAAIKDIPSDQIEKVNLAKREVIGKIEKEAEAQYKMKAEVVPLYKGGRHELYLYKRYSDVRLVFAPEASVAFFGGDPANFEFPRADLDVAFFRVYENDKPIEVKDFFKVSKVGTKAGDLTFVSGNPGHTNRLFTYSALEFVKGQSLPLTLELLKRRLSEFREYRGRSEEHKRQSDEDYFSLENSSKVLNGEKVGLDDPHFFERKRAQEQALLDRIHGDPKLQKYLGAWDDVARVQKAKEPNFLRRAFFEGRLAFNSSLFGYARALVRLAEEDAKPNGERLKEYQDAQRKTLEKTLTADVPIYPEFETFKLQHSLQFMVDKLSSKDQYVQTVLAGVDPASRAQFLVGQSQLGDRAYRERLLKGGAAAINASQDVMIVLARAIDPISRELRKEFEEKIELPEALAYQKIADAHFAVFGTSISPDATFTPRLTYGPVLGYTEKDGTVIAPHTVLRDAYKFSDEYKNQEPWDLSERWLTQKDGLDLDTPYNFITKSDTIGGNSGSPVIDTKGEIVGVLFDGNQHDFLKRYSYNDESLGRSVNVDIRAVMETLKKIYHADALVNELQP